MIRRPKAPPTTKAELRAQAMQDAVVVLDRDDIVAYANPPAFNEALNEISAEHYLSEAIVLDRQRVIARTTVKMSVAQNTTASPNGWIDDGK